MNWENKEEERSKYWSRFFCWLLIETVLHLGQWVGRVPSYPKCIPMLAAALGSARPGAGNSSLFSTSVSASSLPFMDLCFVLGLHCPTDGPGLQQPDCNCKTALVAKLEGPAACAQTTPSLSSLRAHLRACNVLAVIKVSSHNEGTFPSLPVAIKGRILCLSVLESPFCLMSC